jgi:hypothetical protein
MLWWLKPLKFYINKAIHGLKGGGIQLKHHHFDLKTFMQGLDWGAWRRLLQHQA